MIRLLLYKFQFQMRVISTYVMLLFSVVAFSLVAETPATEMAPLMAMTYDGFLIVWVTLTFVLQLTGFHHVFFRSEALQYRLARIRNRRLVIGASLIHIAVLAIVASLPFAVIYAGILTDGRTIVLAWSNMLLFYLFLGIATSAIVRLVGTGTSTPFVVLGALFLLPISLNSLSAFAPAFFSNPVVEATIALLGSHLDVSGNTSMLLTRGIQDTDAIFRSLILTPILATFTYVHFQRGDHH